MKILNLTMAEVLKLIPEGSIPAVITSPPWHLEQPAKRRNVPGAGPKCPGRKITKEKKKSRSGGARKRKK
jgi:hypothetical protein